MGGSYQALLCPELTVLGMVGAPGPLAPDLAVLLQGGRGGGEAGGESTPEQILGPAGDPQRAGASPGAHLRVD